MDGRRSLWRREVLSWSLYDFANTIYSMNIASLYLKRYLVEDLGYDDHYYDIPFSISMLLAALLLPALGAMSDYSTKKKLFLFLFTLSCCSAVGVMAAVPPEFVVGTILLFVVANFCYEAGQPFYNALLYSVAEGRQARLVSGIGVAFGYIGSILGMVLVLPFVTGSLFGLDIPYLTPSGKSGSFLPTAVLFLVFALPTFFWVRERPVEQARRVGLRQAYGDVLRTVVQTKKYPGVLRFLIADYFFEDAVATVIINMGLFCSLVIGLAEEEISLFLIISTVSAVAGSFVIGRIAERWALKPLLNVIVWGWVICLVFFVFVNERALIWVLGSLVGIVLGGLWTTSRPLLAELVPRAELGRFFGLFALSGRAAAIIGPLVWTAAVYLFRPDRPLGKAVVDVLHLAPAEADKLPYRTAVLSLVVMMVIGLVIYRRVPRSRGDISDGP